MQRKTYSGPAVVSKLFGIPFLLCLPLFMLWRLVAMVQGIQRGLMPWGFLAVCATLLALLPVLLISNSMAPVTATLVAAHRNVWTAPEKLLSLARHLWPHLELAILHTSSGLLCAYCYWQSSHSTHAMLFNAIDHG